MRQGMKHRIIAKIKTLFGAFNAKKFSSSPLGNTQSVINCVVLKVKISKFGIDSEFENRPATFIILSAILCPRLKLLLSQLAHSPCATSF